MKRWEEKWKKCKKGYYACLRKKGFLYTGMLVWIALRCFARCFFTCLPRGRRYRAVAYLCLVVMVPALLFHASRSWMKTGGNHLTLQVQQKTVEIAEGYGESISYGVAVVNDGEEELTEVEMYPDGDPDFSLEFQEEISENTLAPGERWKAVLKVRPGKKAGRYYVTLVADAAELEETVEQTMRIVIKGAETEEPEPTVMPETAVPELSGTQIPVSTPDVTKEPEPSGTPQPSETPEPSGTQIPVSTPDVTKEPEPSGTPQPSETPELSGTQIPVSTPDVTKEPEPSGTPQPSETPEPSGTQIPVSTPDVTKEPEPSGTPQPSETPELTVVPDDIIRVDVPADARLLMNPAAEEGQITASRLPLVNHSGFPLNVEVTRAVVDIRQNGGMVRKDCSLNIDVLRDDAVVLAIRNLKEGVNRIDTSFLLPPENPAYILFSGSVDEGTGHLWGDGDLHAKVIFRFSKA